MQVQRCDVCRKEFREPVFLCRAKWNTQEECVAYMAESQNQKWCAFARSIADLNNGGVLYKCVAPLG